MQKVLREIDIDNDWYGFCLLGDNHFINKNIYTILISMTFICSIYTFFLIKNMKNTQKKINPIIIEHFKEKDITEIDINYEDPLEELHKPYISSKPPSPIYMNVTTNYARPSSPLYHNISSRYPPSKSSDDFWEQNLNSYDSYDSV